MTAPGPMFDAFISYHSADADWVATLRSALAAKGVRVWLDSEQIRPGDLFPGALARAIGSVKCVVLVLSPGALRSAWVEEEYTLALTHRCQLIGVLVDDVEPPGFLAGRTWVDFRDASEFDGKVAELVFGITGNRPAGLPPASPPSYRDIPASDTGADETHVLQRLIERRRQDAQRLWRARLASTGIGAGLGGTFLALASEMDFALRLGGSLMPPLILSLAAWGVTATTLTRLATKVEQFQVLRDGLEACRSRSHPGCRKLRQHFWDMLNEIATGTPRASSLPGDFERVR